MTKPEQLVGTCRRFGLVGPMYEILGAGENVPDGDRMMRVRVLESGGEVDVFAIAFDLVVAETAVWRPPMKVCP